jgi:hypothetical protein
MGRFDDLADSVRREKVDCREVATRLVSRQLRSSMI